MKQAHPGPGQQVPVVGSSKQEKLPRPTLEEMESAPTDVEEEKGSQLEPEKSKSSGKTEYQHLLEVYHGCLEALNKLKEEENQPKISSKKVARLNEELAAKSEELQQLAGSVKESPETQEESDQKIQTLRTQLDQKRDELQNLKLSGEMTFSPDQER